MPLVFQPPDVGGESGPRPISVAAVTLVFTDPVPDQAVGQASVGLLLACGEVSYLGAVDHYLGHALAWDGALLSSSVSVATFVWLVVVAIADLDVVLIQHLRHVWHC